MRPLRRVWQVIKACARAQASRARGRSPRRPRRARASRRPLASCRIRRGCSRRRPPRTTPCRARPWWVRISSEPLPRGRVLLERSSYEWHLRQSALLGAELEAAVACRRGEGRGVEDVVIEALFSTCPGAALPALGGRRSSRNIEGASRTGRGRDIELPCDSAGRAALEPPVFRLLGGASCTGAVAAVRSDRAAESTPAAAAGAEAFADALCGPTGPPTVRAAAGPAPWATSGTSGMRAARDPWVTMPAAAALCPAAMPRRRSSRIRPNMGP